MKRLCLIRPTHKAGHPMGTESTSSLDAPTPIIILLRQGQTNGKGECEREERENRKRREKNDWHQGSLQM